jgi:hypothetical protein
MYSKPLASGTRLWPKFQFQPMPSLGQRLLDQLAESHLQLALCKPDCLEIHGVLRMRDADRS